ncbi:MAG: HEAT repeat domain-containing protein [Candidatus Heimdallarchaeota archaeon]|nr:HEAT repeat domain-containing protein [Candidatus Heimdallarchaeota archaeon]
MVEEEQEPTLEELLEQLQDEDGKVREKVVKLVLGKLGESRYLEDFRAAIKSLGNIEDKQVVVALLMQALKDEDGRVREGAIRALATDRYAAQVLGEIKPAHVMESLTEALKDENAKMRKYTAQVLGVLKDPRAVEPLIKALEDEEWYVQRDAARALGELGDSQAIVPLISALKCGDGHIKGATEEALKKFGIEKILEPLFRALKDENSYLRKSVIGFLGITLKDSRAVEPLIQAMEDEDTNVRVSVVETLRKFGKEEIWGALIHALKDENDFLRMNAIGLLGSLEDSRAVEPLIQAFEDGDYEIRKSVVEALLKMRDPTKFGMICDRAVEALCQMIQLKALDHVLNMQVVKALGRQEGMKEYFYELVKEGNRDALFVYLDIYNICSDGYIWPIYIDEFEYDFTYGSKLKETITDEDYEELFRILKLDTKPTVKFLIARILGAIGDKRAINPIMELLTAKEDQVVRSAIYALARIGDRSNANKVLKTIKEREGIFDVDGLAGIITKLDAFEEFIEIFKDDPELISNTILDIEENGKKIIKRFIEAFKGEPIFVADVLAKVWYWILDCGGDPLNYEILSRAKEDIVKLRDSITDEEQQAILKRMLREIETEEQISTRSSQALNLLYEDLASGDIPIQLYAIKGLGKLKSVESIDKILPFLDYNDSKYAQNFRWAARSALDKIVSPKALVPLIKELKERGSYRLIEALNKIVKTKLEELINQKDEAAVEILYDFLRSDTESDKLYALWGIKNLQLKKSSVKVLSLLKEEDKNIRKRAAEVLENLGDTTIIAKLREFQKTEEDSSVKVSVEKALKKLEELSKKEAS